MTNHDADRKDFLAAVQVAIKADRQNARKWEPLYKWFEQRLNVKGGKHGVDAKLLTEDKQLSNRIRKELAELDPQYVVLCALPAVDVDEAMKSLDEANLPRARCALLLRETTPLRLQVYSDDAVTRRLAELFPEVAPEAKRRIGSEEPPVAVVGPKHTLLKIPLLVDDRIRRMVRLSVVSANAVILVGPPGTGKTALLAEVLEEVRTDPAKFGFSSRIGEPMWATPEESWTTRELVGGETVDESGRLRFRPGKVLDAIRNNRWLVLDEANRADMDKIFGGMLTWLSGQGVELGRASTDLKAPVVILDWGDKSESTAERVEELEAKIPSGDPIRFLAGTEWRLLGTYNALDAQRVFRFGQAIGRRFARVPIPAPTRLEFERLIDPLLKDLPAPVGSGIIGLYAAHLDSPLTILGPALFIRMHDYIKTGLDAKTGSEMELLAEAYLVNVGTWLAKLDDAERDKIGDRITSTYTALPLDQWTWLKGLLPSLG